MSEQHDKVWCAEEATGTAPRLDKNGLQDRPSCVYSTLQCWHKIAPAPVNSQEGLKYLHSCDGKVDAAATYTSQCLLSVLCSCAPEPSQGDPSLWPYSADALRKLVAS